MEGTGRSRPHEFDPVLVWIGALVFCAGAISALGWLFHQEPLLLVSSRFPTTRYNTSLALMALGAGQIALGRRSMVASAVFGALVAAVAFLTLWQHLFDANLGIDEYFVSDFLAARGNAPSPGHPGRMGLGTATCLLALGLAITLSRFDAAWSTVGGLIAFAGVVSVITIGAILFDISRPISAQIGGGLGAHAAGLVTLSAAALMQWCSRSGSHELGRPVTVGAALGALVLVVVTYRGLDRQAEESDERQLAASAVVAREALEGVMTANVRAVSRLGKRWEVGGERRDAEWVRQANEYLRDLAGLRRLVWLNGDGRVRQVVAASAAEASNAEGKAGRGTGDPSVAGRSSRTAASLPESAVDLVVPVSAGMEGTFVAEFSVSTLVDSVLSRERTAGYRIGLSRVSESSECLRTLHEASVSVGESVRLADEEWRLCVEAKVVGGESSARALPQLVLWGGALFSFTLFFAIDGLLLSRRRTSELEHQRRLAEESEAKYRSLVETMGEGITIIQDDKVAFANAAMGRMMGYEVPELIGMELDRAIGEQHVAMVRERYSARLKGPSEGRPPSVYEMTLRRKDGTSFWAEINAGLSEWHGRPAVTALFRDIDARRRAEEAVVAERSRMSLVARGAIDGIWDWNLVSDEFYASERWRELLGLSSDAALPRVRDWHRLVHPDDARTLEIALDVQLAQTSSFDIECRMLVEKAGYRWFRIARQAAWDAAGRPVRVAGSFADIDARKRAESALTLSETRFRGAMESAPIGMALVSLDGHWIDVNAAMCAIVGYSKEELRSLTFQDLTYPEDLNADLAHLADILSGRIRTYSMEKRYIRKSGDTVWALLSVSLARKEDGTPDYFISQVEDIDQRKRQEQLLRQALKDKELLLREVYHRVKNNLQVTHSLLNIQSRVMTTIEAKKALAEAAARVRAMSLVHEKLYQSGRVERIGIQAFVEQITMFVRESAGFDPERIAVSVVASGHDYEVELDVAVPLGLLINELVTNASKHAFPEGRLGNVRVTVHGEAGEVELAVVDDGVGFSEEVLAEGGTSMGLRLSRGLARQLGGELVGEGQSGSRWQVRFSPNGARRGVDGAGGQGA